MEYADVLKIIEDKNNIILRETVVTKDGVSNVNFVLLNKDEGRILIVWGCNAKNAPDWVLNKVVARGEIVDLTQKQMLTVFNKISYKYAGSEKMKHLQAQKQNTL